MGVAKHSAVKRKMQVTRVYVWPVNSYLGDSAEQFQDKKDLLGNKLLNGHRCHGWLKTHHDWKEEVWTSDDSGLVVHSEITNPLGKKEYVDLQSFSIASPSEDLFKVPTDYRVRE